MTHETVTRHSGTPPKAGPSQVLARFREGTRAEARRRLSNPSINTAFDDHELQDKAFETRKTKRLTA